MTGLTEETISEGLYFVSQMVAGATVATSWLDLVSLVPAAADGGTDTETMVPSSLT